MDKQEWAAYLASPCSGASKSKIPPLHDYTPSGYASAHSYVTQQKGRASDYQCEWCPENAAEWAYDWKDVNELRDDLAYSKDPNHYFPLCVKCHRRFDVQHARDKFRK